MRDWLAEPRLPHITSRAHQHTKTSHISLKMDTSIEVVIDYGHGPFRFRRNLFTARISRTIPRSHAVKEDIFDDDLILDYFSAYLLFILVNNSWSWSFSRAHFFSFMLILSTAYIHILREDGSRCLCAYYTAQYFRAFYAGCRSLYREYFFRLRWSLRHAARASTWWPIAASEGSRHAAYY